MRRGYRVFAALLETVSSVGRPSTCTVSSALPKSLLGTSGRQTRSTGLRRTLVIEPDSAPRPCDAESPMVDCEHKVTTVPQGARNASIEPHNSNSEISELSRQMKVEEPVR